MSLMAELRGRIGVIAPANVVRAIGDVFRHEKFQTEEAQQAMAKALQEMRTDVASRGDDLTKDEMIQIMFGSRERLQ